MPPNWETASHSQEPVESSHVSFAGTAPARRYTPLTGAMPCRTITIISHPGQESHLRLRFWRPPCYYCTTGMNRATPSFLTQHPNGYRLAQPIIHAPTTCAISSPD